ncbi:MAG TPA: type II secretion system F family protein [Candidatus Paceibacterota bacterium]|nr:type II secretion system F family protein [Candidatus Paceibacterota bacterium]
MINRELIVAHTLGAGKQVIALSYATVTTLHKHSEPVRRSFKKLSDKYIEMRNAYELKSAPRLSVKDQMFFAKRLSFLIKAGVPILESLHMISSQTASRQSARVIGSVYQDISNGSSLAKSLGKFPHIFGDFGINIIKIGESSGTLSTNLEYLADELKKRHSLQGKVVSAFIYPGIITLATLGITAFLMLYLFPKIMPIFSSLHMELPLTTKIVMAISLFLQAWGLLLIGVIIAACIGISLLKKKNKQFHFFFDQVVLSMPLFGPLMRYYNLANGTRTLGILLQGGVTLSEALPLTADTTANLVYKAEYRKMAEYIHRGERMSSFLVTSENLFPPIMAQLIAVGERSGNLSNTLVYLSELYEAEVEDFTKNLSSLIEPALMVIMGILVGFVAISIITPIYGITQNLHT